MGLKHLQDGYGPGSTLMTDPGDEKDRTAASREWTADSPRLLSIARGIHVVPGPARGWEVRTLGPHRIRRWFPACSEALSFALDRQREERVDVIVHHQVHGSRRIKILEAEPAPGRDD